MDINREINSLIRDVKSIKPFSIIGSEISRLGVEKIEYIKVRRILREWSKHFNDIKDSTYSKLLDRIILLIGGKILEKNIDRSKRSLYIPKDKLNSLYEEYSNNLPDIVIDKIRRGEIDFPYKKYSISESDVDKAIQNIKMFTSSEFSDREYSLPDVKFSDDLLKIWSNPLLIDDRYGHFVHDKMEYDKMDYITDYFTEQQRMSSVRADQVPTGLSPLEIWKQGQPIVREILMKAIEKVLIGSDAVLTPKLLRECIYELGSKTDGIKESTQFKISLAMSVMKKFLPEPKASNVLDISAGWGDRLIAAIGCDVGHYVATDPNTSLQDGHRNIIERFASSESRGKFKIIYEPFETAVLPTGIEYDLVFTSPPFFNLEIYSNEATQSVAKYSDNLGWLVNFLFKSLEKAWSVLKVGGTMAIHITDTPSIRVCEPMILFCSWKLRGCEYRGVVGSLGGAGLVRPIWVFRKGSSSPHSRKAEKVLKNNHREVYELCK
tara:strand:+ start:457 stop:1932 length:1476 start_codon:yes stop_codon:yes gene_type:complete